MQQQNKPAQNNKARQGFLPWIVLGIAALLVIAGIIVIPALKDKSPPRPVGPPTRIPKVNLIIHSNVGGAEVYLNDQKKAVISDLHHKATLFNLAPKAHQVTLKKQGYADRTETVEITGQTISQTVQLDMQPGE